MPCSRCRTDGVGDARAWQAHTRPDAAARVEALAKVGIPDPERRLDAYPHELSGGMRQRVAIAIAFLNNPGLVICDEPTTALDVSIQAQILVEMRTLVREAGVSLIWISHDLATVSVLASRLLVMYAGRLIEQGPTAEVLQAAAPPLHARPDPQPAFARRAGARSAADSRLDAVTDRAAQRLRLQGPLCTRQRRLRHGAAETVEERARTWRCHHPLNREPACTAPAHAP